MDVVSLDIRCYSNCRRLCVGEDRPDGEENRFKEIWGGLGQEVFME